MRHERRRIERILNMNYIRSRLDEATASVDADNERYIQQAMSELCRDKTVLVIAHRLNTIQGADEILVLEHGSIVERGSHEQLMKMNGIYHHMVNLQEDMHFWSQEVSHE